LTPQFRYYAFKPDLAPRWRKKIMRIAMQMCVLIAALSFAGVASAGVEGEAAGSVSLSPQEAGARYGQALGAGRLCKGFKVLPGAEELAATFKGEELATFKRAAARVVQAWQSTTDCQDGPNICMRSHMASCHEAMREIGPKGVRYPGLIGSGP
jgi:hypothetical protein